MREVQTPFEPISIWDVAALQRAMPGIDSTAAISISDDFESDTRARVPNHTFLEEETTTLRRSISISAREALVTEVGLGVLPWAAHMAAALAPTLAQLSHSATSRMK